MNEIPLKGEVKSSNFANKIIYHQLNRALYQLLVKARHRFFHSFVAITVEKV